MIFAADILRNIWTTFPDTECHGSLKITKHIGTVIIIKNTDDLFYFTKKVGLLGIYVNN